MNATPYLQIAGLLQISLLAPGLTMARVVGLREQINGLPSFTQRLFWVYYAFTGIHFVGCGAVTFACADQLNDASGLARGFCAFLAFYWAARVAVAFLIFDVRPFLTTGLHQLGHYVLNTVFIYLTTVFAWVALRPAP